MVSTPFGRGPRISAAAYTGRAVAPGAVAQPDPVTTGLITRNSLQLGVVANQIQGLTAQMQSLTGSLQVIGGSLRQQQNLLAQKEQTEQELENRLSQQQLREGKEGIIEKKITAAALQPAEKVATKAQFTLGRLGNFFLTLLGGWLLTASVQLLQKYGDEVKDKFSQIKEFSINTFNVISGVIGTIVDTISNVTTTLSNLATKIKELATTGIFSDLVGQLTSVATNAGKDIANTVGGVVGLTPYPDRKEEQKAAEGGDNKENEVTSDVPEGGEQSKNVFQDLFEKGMNLFGGNPLDKLGQGGPSMAEPTETMMGDKVDPQLQELKNERAGIRQEFMSGRIDKEEYESTIAGLDKKINDFGAASQNVQPQETALGKPAEKLEESEQTVDPETPAKYGEKSLQVEEGDASQKAEVEPQKRASEGKSTVDIAFDADIKSFVNTEKYIGKTGTLPMMDFDIAPKSKEVAKRVSTPPEEPGVTVVPIPMESGDSGGQQQAPAPVSGGAIAATPAYLTFNPDMSRFYGATSHFNVIV